MERISTESLRACADAKQKSLAPEERGIVPADGLVRFGLLRAQPGARRHDERKERECAEDKL